MSSPSGDSGWASFGLTDEVAAAHLAEGAARATTTSSGRGYRAIAARQLLDPLAALLVVAVAVSLAIGEVLDAAAIAAIVVLNAVLGFAQEAGAERAVRALREGVSPRATVRRSGRDLDVPAGEVVAGDVVLLREGDRIAADGWLGESFGLEVDESMLTGESVPVAKARDGSADRVRVFAGTAVTRGRATFVADAVADATELGRIATLTDEARSPATPMQRRFAALSRQMVVLGLVVTGLLTGGMILRGSSFDDAFLVGVSVAVAAVPEGLATTVTIALALAARAMARRHAIVRRLDATETLGEVSVICTDKTGTLTENRLELISVGRLGGWSDADVLTAALLASSTLALESSDGPARADPLELAIVGAAREAGLEPAEIGQMHEFVGEIPFDPERRRMSRVWRQAGRHVTYTKGAPEAILAGSALGEAERASVAMTATGWGDGGLRVLAVARRELPSSVAVAAEALEQELDIVGLIAFRDPLRSAVRDAVHTALAAGIEVRMLTGDHAATARAVAAELGIPDEWVAARVTPEDKLRIVERLQAEGHVVAVTGDGVNDAPALRRADVGISMGRSGTEAAREASDVVLTDDDFSTIVAAVREGRVIAHNVRSVTAFLLSANLGEVLLFAAAVTLGFGAPMTVIQVLLVNLLTDGLPAIALARDPASADTMRSPTRRANELFSRATGKALVALGLCVGASALAAYLVGRTQTAAVGQTMGFATVALAELAIVFSFRSERLSAWRLPANPLLVLGCVASAAIVALLVFLPGAHSVVGTTSLSTGQVLVVVVLSLVPAAIAESAKYVTRRGRRPSG